MKLIRAGAPGQEKPAIIVNEKWYDVSSLVKDYDEDFFANDGISQLTRVVSENKLPEIDKDYQAGLPGKKAVKSHLHRLELCETC